MMRYLVPTLTLTLIAGCSSDIPDRPTWFSDVQPIIRANCARCHGADPASVRIAGYRLDRHVAEDPDTTDAFDYGIKIVEHAVDHVEPSMPPDYVLTDRQQEILARWVATGSLKGERPNSSPRIELVEPVGLDENHQSMNITVRAWDDDLDALAVQLYAKDLSTGYTRTIGNLVGAGMRTQLLDVGSLAHKHTFEIFANVDDGYHAKPSDNEHVVVVVPELAVDHGLLGTAPDVRLIEPNAGGTHIGSLAIRWTATDPDVSDTGVPDALTIELALVPYADDGTPITSGIITIATNPPDGDTYTWQIPATVPTHDSFELPIPYKVRVTATDTLGEPRNVRSAESAVVLYIEQRATTMLGWANVEPTFATYCGTSMCHDKGGVGVAPEFCALQYQRGNDTTACDATDVGIYERRSDVLARISVDDMPPPGKPRPSASERTQLIEWLRADAPFTSGGTPPTFSWSAPTVTQTTYPVIISWSARDAEGLTSGELQSTEVMGSCSNDNCCASINAAAQTWTTLSDPMAKVSLAGATTWSGTLQVTLPIKPGKYHCIRGVVVDTSSLRDERVNAAGLR